MLDESIDTLFSIFIYCFAILLVTFVVAILILVW